MRRALTFLTTSAIIFSLVFSVLTPARIAYADQSFADAASGALGCAAAALILSLLDSAGFAVPTSDVKQGPKELALDCAAWVLNNIVLEQMTADIVGWINSGFDGNPAFVDNPTKFLGDIANEVTGAFIEDAGLEELLCGPFSIQIRLSLLTQPSFRDRARCTLEDVVENIDDFIEGDFEQGGWVGWFNLTQTSANNPYGAYFELHGELGRRIAERLGKEEDYLKFGGGFKTQEECIRWEEYDGPPNPNAGPDELRGECLETRAVTPGSLIENQLNVAVGSPRRRLEVADEMNEVLSALFSTLLQELISDEGLRGIDSGDIQGSGEVDIGPILDAIADGGGGSGFNMTCPAGGVAGSEVISWTRPRPFEVPEGGGALTLRIDGMNGHYTKGTIEFDVYMEGLLAEEERPVVGGDRRSQQFVTLRHTQDQFNGWFIFSDATAEFTSLGAPGNRRGSAQNYNREGGPLTEGQWHSVRIEYDAEESRTVTMQIRPRDGGAPTHNLEFPIANSIYSVNGVAPTLIFDASVIQGTYNVSHVGAIYDNISFEFIPGEPVCGATGGTPPDDGGLIDDSGGDDGSIE